MNNFSNTILVDMDDVLVDFCNHPVDSMNMIKIYGSKFRTVWGPKEMYQEGFWLTDDSNLGLQPLNDAVSGIRALISRGYDVWICTKPVHDYIECYSGKAQWIRRWLPELSDRLIMTQNKDLVAPGAWLIDDQPKNLENRGDSGILFDTNISSKEMWKKILDKFPLLL